MKNSFASLLIFTLLVFLNPVFAELPQELDWDAMIPEDYRPDKIMEQFGDINELDDDDPRTQQIMDELEAAFSAAPVVESL
ncbi:MAG: DUF3299 domain-containing protein, partial [Gammaproteobacteria bacterium]|nr:DUF3299 domain-containing protein [Gammaproteobacteria bacterium]